MELARINRNSARAYQAAALLILILSLWTRGATPCEAPPVSGKQYDGLRNFQIVDEHVCRGAQPTRVGIDNLHNQLGIKSVVNLRGDDERVEGEGEYVRSLGMQYFSVPLKGFSRPSDAKVKEVLSILNDSTNWPVFVHCERGADRTGTVVACYRISHSGWTLGCARAEASRYGMSRFERGMRQYIGDFARREKATS